MVRNINEKSLGNVSVELFDRIDQAVSCRNDLKKKQFVTSAMEFFLSLPDSVIDTLLLRSPASDDFKDLSKRVTRPNIEQPVPLDALHAERGRRKYYQNTLKKLSSMSKLPPDVANLVQEVLKRKGPPSAQKPKIAQKAEA